MTVIDASAMVELLPGTPTGESCRERLLRDGEDLCTPHLLDVEVSQVLRRYASMREITPDRGAEALADPAAMSVMRYPHGPLLERAWDLHVSSSVYDAVYLALAEALDAPLVTCDARISRTHGHRARVEVVR